MAEGSQTARLAGWILAVGGVLLFVGDNLHPHDDGADYAQSTAAQLANASWAPAHWLILLGGLCVVWAVWMLLDAVWREQPAVVQAGARLTILAGLFMVVQWAVELAMPSARAALTANGAAPMVSLSAAMHVVGFPALMLGLILLITGLPNSAPLIVRIIGLVGALAMGLAGPVVDGLQWLAWGPLFMGAAPLALWIVWTGVALGLSRRAGVAAASA